MQACRPAQRPRMTSELDGSPALSICNGLRMRMRLLELVAVRNLLSCFQKWLFAR